MIHQKRYYESKVRQSDVASHKDTTVKQETLSSLNPDASMFISNNQLEEKLNVLEKTLTEDLKGIKRQLDKVVSQKTKYTSSRERLQTKKVQERDSKFLKQQFYRQKWFKVQTKTSSSIQGSLILNISKLQERTLNNQNRTRR